MPTIELTFTAAEERELTEKIRTDLVAVWELIVEAYRRRAWEPLGYDSWEQYCDAEFASSRLRLPRRERPEIVIYLREQGFSIRAIAAATGTAPNTVQRDLHPVAQPSAAGGGAPAEALLASRLTCRVIG
jgi:hypothetical protein